MAKRGTPVFCLTIFLVFFGPTNGFSQTESQLGRVNITIIDSITRQLTPVRVRLTNHGRAVKRLPDNAVAVMYGLWDHADGYGYQPDSAFYVDGTFELMLPVGEYNIFLSKGFEYLDQLQTFQVTSSATTTKVYAMKRWVDMPSRGWYSADDHIHMRRSPREDSLIMKWIQAEDVHVGILLRMGDFWATYYDQYAWGEKGVYKEDDYLLTSGQEDPRTPEIGHALGIGASDKVRYANEYYYYDKVFDRLHELGGISGYAHQAESFHGYRGLMLDGLRRKVDALELLQFCVSEEPLQTRHYYHLLDLGYAVTAIAGSDFPWCGKDHSQAPPERNARIGNARFYTHLKSPLSYAAWKVSLKKGHTFVTSGPMIDFTINGSLPGDTLNIKKGSSLKIAVQVYGHTTQVPLDHVEVISHGKIIASASATEKGQSISKLTIEKEIKVEEGMWIAVRAFARKDQAAHTTPIYVSVNNSGFHNKQTLTHYLDLAEQYLQELQNDLQKVNESPELQGWRYRKGIEKRIHETRQVIQHLREKGK